MQIKRFLTFAWFLILTLVGLISAGARGEVNADQFDADLNAIAAGPTRAVGTTGYNAALDYLTKQIQSLPNVELQTQAYTVMAPVTRSAAIFFGDGRRETIYPVLPAGIRLNATPAEGIAGDLVYCGDGSPAKTPAGRVKGNVAVLEGDAADQWKSIAGFGPAAIVLLGDSSVTHFTLRWLETTVPVNIPRFYLPDGKAAQLIRDGAKQNAAAPKVVLQAGCDWQRVTARNLYAYVAPRNPLPPGDATQRTAYAALAIVVPVDASGLVTDLSPAAGQAAQPAAALAILRDLAVHPPRRPVLVCFTGADANNLLGSRQMMMAFGDAPSKWRGVISTEVDPELAAVTADLARAKAVAGDPSQLQVVADRRLIARVVKIVETDIALEQDELFRLRVLTEAQITDALRARMKALDGRQIDLSEIKFAFQSDPADLKKYDAAAKVLLARVIDRLGGNPAVDGGVRGLLQEWTDRKAELQRRLDLFDWLATRVGRGKDPDARSNDDRLIELAIGLDLTDGAPQAGPIFWGRVFNQQSIAAIQEYREWFDRLDTQSHAGDASAAWFGALGGSVNFDPFKLVRSQITFLTAPLGLPTEIEASWGIPSLTFATLEDQRPRRDTPLDTLDHVDTKKILPQLAAVDAIVRHAADDPGFVGQPEFRRNNNQFEGQVVSTASGRPIPDLPRPGFLASINYLGAERHIPPIKFLPFSLGVRRSEIVDCDAEGNYAFEGLPRVNDMKEVLVKVYRVAPGTGEINAASDLGQQSADLKTWADLDQSIDPLRSVVFDCREFTLVGLYDPRFLQALGEVQLIDARRNAEPQRFNILVGDQMAAGQLEPGSRIDLLLRYGRIGNRIVLLNMPAPAVAATRPAAGATGNGLATVSGGKSVGEGLGYTIDQLNSISPLSLATARDFWRLNDTRIEEYRKAGVTSPLIDSLHKDSGEQITAAATALKDSDTPTLIRASTGAWATEARVYDAVQKMANDVIYAAIFLLLLAVPFSFCMERLLVGTSSIYKQIGWASGIFGLMTAALWAFHPAFKISSSPLIIVLAFAIILMSVVVISVVYSKFDVELKRLRSGRGTAEGASFASASVLASAIMLGIANMRRRKFRTALTAITVILITFAVLCFTSTSRYQGVLSLPTGIDATYPGLLLRQRGFRPMSSNVLEGLRTAYPGKQFVEMWWTLNAGESKDQVDLIAGPHVVPVAALLGLSPGAARVSIVGDLVPGFDRLEKGEANIIYLPLNLADQLAVKTGDVVHLAGQMLTVAGLYDPSAFDQRASILSGEPMTPLKYSSGALDASGQRLTDNNVDTLDLDAGSTADEAGASYEHLPATQIAIVPVAVSRSLENSSLRLVAVRTAADDEKADDRDASVKTIVNDITQRFALATFGGYSDGVKLVSASNLASVGGGANVAIPLAIGGLIIFNTMMGSIAERKREIHVYTSLGLAPFHVGALFIAEAMTYGLIGSVFGYIIGQGIGTALLKLGMLGNVTLNYSGSSAMMTLGLILLIVLLSALVPARLASKVAAPSIDRSWRVPDPVNNQIIALLPFTINRTAAEGVVGYLNEFLEAHQEGSIGKFSAGNIEAFASTSDDGKPTRGLQTVIWLTPFDLGVRQHMLLLIAPGEFPEIYEVRVVLERLSGDDGSWWRMNRTFLTELRKEFLQWRSLSPQRMREYVTQSHQLFETAPEEVAVIGTGEAVRLA